MGGRYFGKVTNTNDFQLLVKVETETNKSGWWRWDRVELARHHSVDCGYGLRKILSECLTCAAKMKPLLQEELPLPPGWVSKVDTSGKIFYRNLNNGLTQWEYPPSVE